MTILAAQGFEVFVQQSPYFVYLKMAYHLSQEARDGLSQYRAPASFGLLPFQEAAVQIAAHHVSKRNGVIIGDVVGLGKTLVGTAIAHLCEEDYGTSTLDEQLAKLVTFLREHDALCVINLEERRDGAQIICSMGLFRG